MSVEDWCERESEHVRERKRNGMKTDIHMHVAPLFLSYFRCAASDFVRSFLRKLSSAAAAAAPLTQREIRCTREGEMQRN